MPPDLSRPFASGPLPIRLQRELARLAPVLDGVVGVWGLHLRPHPDAPGEIPAHLLSTVVNIALADDGSFGGDARCDGLQLPFASESFKLVIAQHVLEQARSAEQLAEELARVLAPEGISLLFGFNPASLWRAWAVRRLAGSWQVRAASSWRDVLARSRLDVLQVRYSGLWSPWAAKAGGDSQAGPWLRPLGRFGGSWLLLARKRSSSLTPLRLNAVRSDLKVNPTLAHGARRECA